MSEGRVVGIIMIWLLVGVYLTSMVLREWSITRAAAFAAGWFLGGGLVIFLKERLCRSMSREGRDEH